MALSGSRLTPGSSCSLLANTWFAGCNPFHAGALRMRRNQHRCAFGTVVLRQMNTMREDKLA